MKTSKVLRHPLLLVFLAVSWAGAVPLVDQQDTKDIQFKVDLEKFLENNPELVDEMYPELVKEATDVYLTVDEDVLLQLLKQRLEEISSQDEEEGQYQREKRQFEVEENHTRQKRQTAISGGLNGSSNPFGHALSGSASVDHTFGNGAHNIAGTVQGSHQSVHGMGSANDYSAGLKYTYKPSDKTSLGVSAHRNWGSGGTSSGFGIKFSHKFRR